MSYQRIKATASARAHVERSEAEQRLEAERRISAASNRFMHSVGMTCQEWLDNYLGRNRPADVAEPNTETEHGDENRREAAGTQAPEVGAGEGVGNAPSEGGEAARHQSVIERYDPRLSAHAFAGTRLDDPGNEDSWVDEAWPEGSQGADFTEKDRTPF